MDIEEKCELLELGLALNFIGEDEDTEDEEEQLEADELIEQYRTLLISEGYFFNIALNKSSVIRYSLDWLYTLRSLTDPNELGGLHPKEIMYAAKEGHLELVTLLLNDDRCDPSAQDK